MSVMASTFEDAPRPWPRLHRLDAFDLARRPHDRDPGVRRQVVVLEVDVPERERLVVEAARALADLLGRRRQESLALPAFGLALARQQGAVDLALFEQRDQERADEPAVLHAVYPLLDPRRVALLDAPHALDALAVRAPVIFQVDSYCNPPRGQKSQHNEQPVHILTSSGRSSSPMPMESVGQAATHTPHCTQRSASITAFSRSQNQTFPGASSMSFIMSLMSKPAITRTPRSDRLPQRLAQLGVPLPPGPLVEALALATLFLELFEDGDEGVGDVLGRLRALHPVDKRSVLAEGAAESYVHAFHDGVPRLRGLAAEAYVPDLGLSAGGRAAGEVHPHGLLARYPRPSRPSRGPTPRP